MSPRLLPLIARLRRTTRVRAHMAGSVDRGAPAGPASFVVSVLELASSRLDALTTVLVESDGNPVDHLHVDLAQQAAHAVTDALAAVQHACLPVALASAATALDTCHLAREVLRRHQDRTADLINAAMPTTPGALADIAELTRLNESLAGQLVLSTWQTGEMAQGVDTAGHWRRGSP